MAHQDREVDQAIVAFAAELMKLSALEGEARATLGVTIENALSRLVLAITAQTTQAPPAEPKLVEQTPSAALV